MYTKVILLIAGLTCFCSSIYSQKTHKLSFKINITDSLKKDFDNEGRLFLCLSTDHPLPVSAFHPGGSNVIAKNIRGFPIEEGLVIKKSNGWTSVFDWSFENIPEGTYYVQAVWKPDPYFGFRQDGVIYSTVQKVIIDKKSAVVLNLDWWPRRKLIEHPLVREIDIQSDTLSSWWDKPMHIKASVLLPSGYDENSSVKYPIRYNVAGYGGRYFRVESLINDKGFMSWWESNESPQVINVFLDGYGPYGDCYQLDSENSGPYGYSLIHEQIPFIESKYRGTSFNETRFVDGCSTGGWVSLALQLIYPDVFNGCFSYSPDGVDFENFQLINIYEDQNAFVNEHGYEQPMRRSIIGEPMWSMREYIAYENIQSSTNSYTQSGGQFSAFNALYGTKAENGFPSAMFDPLTGTINTEIARQWGKYDLLKYVKENWTTLGPKIAGKIYVSIGDMDDFYLNIAMRSFDAFLLTTENPKSNAKIEFLPTVGHCRQYSHRTVLEQIAIKLNE